MSQIDRAIKFFASKMSALFALIGQRALEGAIQHLPLPDNFRLFSDLVDHTRSENSQTLSGNITYGCKQFLIFHILVSIAFSLDLEAEFCEERVGILNHESSYGK